MTYFKQGWVLPLLTVAVAAALLIPATVLAQPPAGPPGGRPGAGLGLGSGPGFGPGGGPRGGLGPFGNFAFLSRFLNLTEEQQTQAQALRDQLRDDSATLRDQSRARRDELRTALNADSPDATHIGELAIALHNQRGQLRALVEKAVSDFEALLTQEQLESFQQLRDAVRERRANRHGQRRGQP